MGLPVSASSALALETLADFLHRSFRSAVYMPLAAEPILSFVCWALANDVAVRHIQPFGNVTTSSSLKFTNSTVELQQTRRGKKSGDVLSKILILCWAGFTAVLSRVQEEGWAGLTGPKWGVRQGFALIPLSHCPKGKARSPSRFPLCN